MRLSNVILVLIAGIIAIAVGWVYQSQDTIVEKRTELEIPVDIDYYLSKVKYRAMTESGELDYMLQSPYLQHFKQADISRLDKPKIDIYRNGLHWQAEANSAEMIHKLNSLHLIEDVRLTNQNSQIDADSAVFDLDRNIYSLTNTKTIFYNDKS